MDMKNAKMYIREIVNGLSGEGGGVMKGNENMVKNKKNQKTVLVVKSK